MSYLAQFKYDLFISYSHDDNEPDPWVTEFEGKLQERLRKLNFTDVKIWRDTEIQKSESFNDVIRNALDHSAILLALTSPRSLDENSYCKDEREHFFQKSRKGKPGLKIGTHYRIMNVLLYDISKEKWPKEYGQGSFPSEGFSFFERNKENPHDTFGSPVDPTSDIFKRKVHQLVDALIAMLHAFNLELDEKNGSTPKAASAKSHDAFKVYFADVQEDLKTYKRGAKSELESENIFFLEDVPEPYPLKEHDDAVTERIKKADLTVHLLNEKRGEPIDRAPKQSYPQRQADLALEHAKSQLIWIPKSLKMKDVKESDDYRQLLQKLRDNPTDSNIQELNQDTPPDFAKMILDKIGRLRSKKEQDSSLADPKSILVDYHSEEEDKEVAHQLENSLDDKGLQPDLFPQKGPMGEQERKSYEKKLEKALKLIIIYGKVNAEWVHGRLEAVQKLMSKKKIERRICGIYLAPPRKTAGHINFVTRFLQEEIMKPPRLTLELIDHSEKFDEAAMEKILGK